MPTIDADLLPGARGKDYHYVKRNGVVYVVYRIKVRGKVVPIAWRVQKNDYKALGINPAKVHAVGRTMFRNVNVLGTSDEIRRNGDNSHPWTKYLKKLSQLYGNVSWLQDKQFMSVMLEGYFEKIPDVELQQRLKQTRWYKSRTDWQRQWELEMAPAQRKATAAQVRAKVGELIEGIYGPGFDPKLGAEQIQAWTKNISSGKWGTPEDGLILLSSKLTNMAEKIEGTAAWIAKQQQIEEQNQYMNRPEDMFERIRQDALVWLGPRATPAGDVLKKWAGELVSGVKSEGDWAKFLRTQAQALYPFLGPNETWQDRASAYKNIVEQAWGRPIAWDNGVLEKIGQRDESGGFTGSAMSYDEFSKTIRQDPRFWGGSVAREQGFQLYNTLQNAFNGVG